MIRMAVMWGGTHRENDRSGLGRTAMACLAPRSASAVVSPSYSAVAAGSVHAVTLDLDRLTSGDYTDRSGEIVVPRAEAGRTARLRRGSVAAPTRRLDVGHGDPDREARPSRVATAQGLRENLCRQFGVTYHKLRGDAALYVDGSYVEPIDPLFVTPECSGSMTSIAIAPYPLDPFGSRPGIPRTATYLGAITLRYAWLPPSFGSVDKERDAVGVNANARFAIMKDYHGVIFSRNGRLIDVQTRTPWTTFINNDCYIKVEVEFSASARRSVRRYDFEAASDSLPVRMGLLCKPAYPRRSSNSGPRSKRPSSIVAWRRCRRTPGTTRLSERAMSAPCRLRGRSGPPREIGPARRPLSDWCSSTARTNPFFRIDRSQRRSHPAPQHGPPVLSRHLRRAGGHPRIALCA